MAAGSSSSPVIDFTSLDYQSVLADLLRYAQAECDLNLTDLNPSDFGVVLAKMMAYATDLLAYNTHQLVGEAFAVLCQRKPNFAKIARAAGYAMPGPQPAMLDLSITVNLGAGPPTSATISRHDKYDTDDGVVFQPDGDVTVGPGVGLVTVVVGATEGDETRDELLAASSGTQAQRYTIQDKPVILESLVLTVGGATWTRAALDILALSQATDHHYALRVGDDGEVTVWFGDGVNGQIPALAAEIRATYKTGGGDRGNVEIGAVRNRSLTLSPLVQSVTNITRGEGGAPAQSLVQAQGVFPQFVRINDRAVSEDDYAGAVVANVAGILKARSEAVGRVVTVYACPAGGSSGSLNPTLVSQAQGVLRTRKMAGRRTRVVEANYGELAVTVDVYVQTEASAADTGTLVRNVVADLHDFNTLDFGPLLDLQALYREVGPEAVAGVSRSVVRRHTLLPYCLTYSWLPPTGDGRARYFQTASGVARREWMVTVTAPGAPPARGSYTVTERILGTVFTLSSVSLEDQGASFPASNGLVTVTPWYLRINPYESLSTARRVVGNTGVSLTVEGGVDLRTLGVAGDEYVVERLQAGVGSIYQDTIVGATAAGAASLALPGTWGAGDEIRVADGVTVFRTRITGGAAGAYTVADPIPDLLAGAVSDAVWVSEDGTVEFAVTRGAVNFAVNDTFYVDTYADLDDIQVRGCVYPELHTENLTVRTIGGRS